MNLFNLVFTLLVSLVLFGCNNPKGGSVLSAGHVPLLKPPGEFNFTTSQVNGQTASVYWDPAPRASEYRVFYGNSPSSITTELQSCRGTNRSCSLNELQKGVSYYFKVVAYNQGGGTGISSIRHVRIIAPFNLTSLVTGTEANQLIVSFPQDSIGAEKYDVRYGTNPSSLDEILEDVTSPAVIPNLIGGDLYYVSVEASNTIGDGITVVSTNKLSETPLVQLAPPNTVSTVAEPGKVNLSWAQTSGAKWYVILRRALGGPFQQIASDLKVRNFLDNTVTNGVTYEYVVRSSNGADSEDSAPVPVRPISTFTLQSATSISISGASISWGAAVGADNYEIYLKNPNDSYVKSATQTGLGFSFTNLQPGTTYVAKVVATNAVTQPLTTSTSNEVTFTTSPLPVSNFTASSNASRTVVLSWTAPSSTAPLTYTVKRGTNSGAYPQSLTTTLTATTYTDTTAVDGTDYFYVVIANNGTPSDLSLERAIRTISNCAISSSMALGKTSLTLSWSSCIGADQYDVIISTSAGATTPVAATLSSSVNSYTATGLNASTNYFLKIRSRNSFGVGVSRLTAETQQVTYPNPPTIAVTGGAGQATLSWPAVNTVTSYRVFRGTQPGEYDTEFTTTTNSRVDTGLTNGQTYYYVVRSNNGYESENSSELGTRPIANFSISTTSVSRNSITVNWPSTIGAESYHIEYRKGSDPFTTLNNQVSGATISGLLSGTPYDVRVYGQSSVGTNLAKVYTPTVVAKTTPTAPAISSISSTSGSITLSWPAVTGGEQYRIYRSTTSGSFPTTPTTSVTTTSYTDAATTPGVSYFYVISAFNGTESTVSNEVSAMPVGTINTPAVTTLSSSSLKVDWVAPTAATSYKVFYKLQTASSYISSPEIVETSYILSGLNSGVSYDVYVMALNMNGTSGASRSSAVISRATLPSTISTLAVTCSEAQKVALSWTPVAGATKYHIYRGFSASSLSYIGAVNGQSAASYLDTGLSGGSVYFYSVRPHNGSVEVADSNIQSIKVIGSFDLTAAQATSATSVNLSWTTASGADTYDVYYGPNVVPLLNIQDMGSSETTSYSLTGLTPGTFYYVSIRARNSQGANTSTVMSLPLTVTTSPSAPVLSNVSVSSGKISFQVANASGASTYNVYRSESSGGPYSQIAHGRTALTFTDSNATNGKSWYYIVRSFNGTESVNSSEVSGLPIPSISINSVADLSSTSLRVTWSFSEEINTQGITYQLNWGTSPTLLDKTETPSSSPFVLTGLSSGTTYYFQMSASSAVGPGMTVTSAISSGSTNSPPVINFIADQETPSNEAKTIVISISDDNDILDCSSLSVSSSNLSVIAPEGILVTGLGTNQCSMVISPSGVVGTTTLSLGISDGKNAASVSFNFNVASCKVDHIGWITEPQSLLAGETWSPAPKVVLKSRDASGPLCDDDVNPVYLSLAKDSSFNQDATVTGTSKVIPVAGFAEFPSTGMTRAGNGYTMVASQGEVVSEENAVPFNVTADATVTQFMWAPMPTSFASEEVPSPTPILYTADQYGNLIAPTNPLEVSLSLYRSDDSLVSSIENSPILTSSGFISLENTMLQESGNFYFRASSSSLATKDSLVFNVSPISRGNVTASLEMLQGAIVHKKNYPVIYPRSTLMWGKNSIAGTNTYKWRIVATHEDSGPATVILREGAMVKASITLTPNTSHQTIYETTFSGPILATGKWTVSMSGESTLYSSQLIIEQVQTGRSLSYIPLSTVSGGQSFITISHSSLQNPGPLNFPTFTYDWSTLPRLSGAKLLMVSKGNNATVCVQLFSKMTNSSIGNELCRMGGAESLLTLDIPIANLPTTLDEIEVRSKSTSGEGHLYKAGLLLEFHGM